MPGKRQKKINQALEVLNATDWWITEPVDSAHRFDVNGDAHPMTEDEWEQSMFIDSFTFYYLVGGDDVIVKDLNRSMTVKEILTYVYEFYHSPIAPEHRLSEKDIKNTAEY